MEGRPGPELAICRGGDEARIDGRAARLGRLLKSIRAGRDIDAPNEGAMVEVVAMRSARRGSFAPGPGPAEGARLVDRAGAVSFRLVTGGEEGEGDAGCAARMDGRRRAGLRSEGGGGKSGSPISSSGGVSLLCA